MNKYNKNHAYLQELDVCTFLSGEKMHINTLHISAPIK